MPVCDNRFCSCNIFIDNNAPSAGIMNTRNMRRILPLSFSIILLVTGPGFRVASLLIFRFARSVRDVWKVLEYYLQSTLHCRCHPVIAGDVRESYRCCLAYHNDFLILELRTIFFFKRWC